MKKTLTSEKVQEIRKLRQRGLTIKETHKLAGVALSVITGLAKSGYDMDAYRASRRDYQASLRKKKPSAQPLASPAIPANTPLPEASDYTEEFNKLATILYSIDQSLKRMEKEQNEFITGAPSKEKGRSSWFSLR